MVGYAAFGTRLLMSDMDLTRTIGAVSQVNDTFTIPGDWRAIFTDGVAFRVVGSTGNDGEYVCDGDATYSAPNTVITVAEEIPHATADGHVAYFPDVGGVTALMGPALSLDTEDVTAHNSTGAYEEVVGTIVRTGEISLEINYDPEDAAHDDATGLPMALRTQQLTDFEVVFPVPAPGGTVWAFSAFVSGFEPGAPHDGKLTAACKLKPTGSMTLA